MPCKVCVFKFESLMPSFSKFYITIVLFCENVTDTIKSTRYTIILNEAVPASATSKSSLPISNVNFWG